RLGGADRAEHARVLVAAPSPRGRVGRGARSGHGGAGWARARRPDPRGTQGAAAPPARGRRAARLPRPRHRGHRARTRDRARHGHGTPLPGDVRLARVARPTPEAGADLMNDQELDLVGTAFTDVHLDRDAHDVISRGRTLRRRRRAVPALATAGVLAVSLSLAV